MKNSFVISARIHGKGPRSFVERLADNSYTLTSHFPSAETFASRARAMEVARSCPAKDGTWLRVEFYGAFAH